jgi:hypothetical protein
MIKIWFLKGIVQIEKLLMRPQMKEGEAEGNPAGEERALCFLTRRPLLQIVDDSVVVDRVQ